MNAFTENDGFDLGFWAAEVREQGAGGFADALAADMIRGCEIPGFADGYDMVADETLESA